MTGIMMEAVNLCHLETFRHLTFCKGCTKKFQM